jgi:hypothetical protein
LGSNNKQFPYTCCVCVINFEIAGKSRASPINLRMHPPRESLFANSSFHCPLCVHVHLAHIIVYICRALRELLYIFLLSCTYIKFKRRITLKIRSPRGANKKKRLPQQLLHLLLAPKDVCWKRAVYVYVCQMCTETRALYVKWWYALEKVPIFSNSAAAPHTDLFP